MRLLVLLWGCLGLPGSKALSGPEEISAFEGDTVSLQCTYEEALKAHRKYWCREGGFLLSRCSGIVYSKEDQEVTQDRVSIRDSPQELSLTVTMRGVTLKDAGKYWCGVDRLGFGEAFKVSLTVFPGKGDSPSTAGVSPLRSFQSLIATTSLKPSTKAWQTQPPELTSPDLHPTVAMAKQGKIGVEAPVFTRAAPAWSTGTSPPPGTSPHAGSTPHTATSPHAGSFRPAIWFTPTTPKGSSAVTSNSVSKPSASILMVRMLAPVLVLLSLLLATGLIAFGSHMLQWRKKAWLATETQKKEKVYLPTSLGKGWDSEDAVVNLAASSRPFGSPKLSAGPSAEIQYLSQSTEDEVAPNQDSEDDIMTTPPLMSSEELGFSEFISV